MEDEVEVLKAKLFAASAAFQMVERILNNADVSSVERIIVNQAYELMRRSMEGVE